MQQGSLAIESALALSILALLMVSGISLGLQTLVLHEDQRAISAKLRAKAQQPQSDEQSDYQSTDQSDHQSTDQSDHQSIDHSDPFLKLVDADDLSVGLSHRSVARMIWLKNE